MWLFYEVALASWMTKPKLNDNIDSVSIESKAFLTIEVLFNHNRDVSVIIH